MLLGLPKLLVVKTILPSIGLLVLLGKFPISSVLEYIGGSYIKLTLL